MSGTDIKTKAIVLRRTNLGEADRLLDLLTPTGKITAYARSVRKEKSRLAGGIEMFCLSEVTIHHSPSRNRNVLTSAKMQNFYRNLLTDFGRLELASEILKRVSRASESVDNPDYFSLTYQSLESLDRNFSPELVKAWFYLNFLKTKGEQINLLFDTNGEKLREDKTYVWDSNEAALKPLVSGKITSDHIKLMRLMLSSPLSLISRVKNLDALLPEVLYVAKSLNQL